MNLELLKIKYLLNQGKQKNFLKFDKLWFPWKPVDVQLGTIPEIARFGDFY